MVVESRGETKSVSLALPAHDTARVLDADGHAMQHEKNVKGRGLRHGGTVISIEAKDVA